MREVKRKRKTRKLTVTILESTYEKILSFKHEYNLLSDFSISMIMTLILEYALSKGLKPQEIWNLYEKRFLEVYARSPISRESLRWLKEWNRKQKNSRPDY